MSSTGARSLELLFLVSDTVFLGTIGLVQLDFLIFVSGADNVGVGTVGGVLLLVVRLLLVSQTRSVRRSRAVGMVDLGVSILVARADLVVIGTVGVG